MRLPVSLPASQRLMYESHVLCPSIASSPALHAAGLQKEAAMSDPAANAWPTRRGR